MLDLADLSKVRKPYQKRRLNNGTISDLWYNKVMRICKDGRIGGQNNKGAGTHLGILTGRKPYIKKGNASEVKQGDKNPMYGRSHSLETRKKMSEAQKGDKSYNWKGGITSQQARIRGQIEFRLWREAVFARDNWTCRECGKRGKGFHAHHLKSFAKHPELRFAIDNGVTLCYACHKLTNNYAGGNNGNETN